MSTLIKRIHDTPCKVSYISIQINKMRVHTNMSTLIKRIHDTPCKVSYISIQIHEVWTHCNFHSSSSAHGVHNIVPTFIRWSEYVRWTKDWINTLKQIHTCNPYALGNQKIRWIGCCGSGGGGNLPLYGGGSCRFGAYFGVDLAHLPLLVCRCEVGAPWSW